MPAFGLKFSRGSAAGLTLLELVISLTILALVTGMGMTMVPGMLESVRRGDTEAKLNRIETALEHFRIAYNRLPCPSDIALAESHANFGVEAANKGSCTGGSPAATYGPAKKVVEGGIPYKKLGLPKEDAYDGWGRRIAYAVWSKMTSENAFLTYSYQDASCGGITVRNDSELPVTTKALYVVFSHGADGHGGHRADGTRVNAGNSDAMTLENCNCTAAAAAGTWDTEYAYKHEHTATFDDHLRYKYRWQFQDNEQRNMKEWGDTCTAGFRIDGLTTNDGLGGWLGVMDVNSDGHDDLVISKGNSAVTHVLFGNITANWPSVFSLSTLDGQNGFRVQPQAWASCWNNAYMADVDGDGIQDFLTGDCAYQRMVIFGGATSWEPFYRWNPNLNIDGAKASMLTCTACRFPEAGYFTTDVAAGILAWSNGGSGVTLVRNGPRPWPTSRNVSTLTHGSQRIMFTGSFHTSGPVMRIADVNNDGQPDLVFGSNADDSFANRRVHIIYGGAGPSGSWGGPYALADLNTADNPSGKIIWAPSGPRYFGGILQVGDFTGNGKNDLFIGHSEHHTHVFKGGMSGEPGTDTLASGWNRTTTLDGTTGFTISSSGVDYSTFSSGNVRFGNSAVPARLMLVDVNNDGINDIIAVNNRGSHTSSGLIGIRYGGANYTTPTTNWSDANGTNGTVIFGAGNAVSGYRPIAAGDVTGDGLTDLVVSNYNYSSARGAVYVLFGQPGGWPAYIDLTNPATLDGTTGFRIYGMNASDGLGENVAIADMNKDGINDIIVSAAGTDFVASNSGSVYVIYGKKSGWSATFDLSDLD